MSRRIKITPEDIALMQQEFAEAVQKANITDGKVSYTKEFKSDDKKASVVFTPEAYEKMFMLIQEFSKEVAWHGIAKRSEREDMDEYVVYDIVVYPQEVTGANVDMDPGRYAQWICENAADDRFNHIYMQGHSHVNMGVSPSGVDLNHQEEILRMLGDEDFYIFMIYNKSMKHDIRVYDMKNNIMYEDKDISVSVVGWTTDLTQFLKDAKDMVKEKYNYNYNYNSQKPPVTPAAPTTPAPRTPAATTPAPYNPLRKEDKPRECIGAGWRGAAAQRSLYDDDYGYGAWRD